MKYFFKPIFSYFSYCKQIAQENFFKCKIYYYFVTALQQDIRQKIIRSKVVGTLRITIVPIVRTFASFSCRTVRPRSDRFRFRSTSDRFNRFIASGNTLIYNRDNQTSKFFIFLLGYWRNRIFTCRTFVVLTREPTITRIKIETSSDFGEHYCQNEKRYDDFYIHSEILDRLGGKDFHTPAKVKRGSSRLKTARMTHVFEQSD